MDATRFYTLLRSLTADLCRTRLRLSTKVGASLALIMALLLAGPTLSALRIETNAGETLVGTNGNDLLTGLGGDDLLKGKAGNDVYSFGDDWGQDTIIELETYQLGGQTVPGGTDTLSFKGVTNESIDVSLVPEWGPNFAMACSDPCVDRVDLAAADIENVVGSQGSAFSIIRTGSGHNVLNPGGGVDDYLIDLGGFNDGAGGKPELAPSSDTYRRLTMDTDTIRISDWGGNDDVIDLRPLEIGEIYLTPIDADSDRNVESLQVVISETSQILVLGQFGEYLDNTQTSDQHGQIETLLFADGSQSAVTGAALASAQEQLSKRQQELAQAAPRLLAEVTRDRKDAPKPDEPWHR